MLHYITVGPSPGILHEMIIARMVLGVIGKPLFGEERRRGQELCGRLDKSLIEVVGVWALHL